MFSDTVIASCRRHGLAYPSSSETLVRRIFNWLQNPLAAPDDISQLEQSFEQLMSQECPRVSWTLLCQDSEHFWFETHRSPTPLDLESHIGHSIADGLTSEQLGRLSKRNNQYFLVVRWRNLWLLLESPSPLIDWLQLLMLSGCAIGQGDELQEQSELLGHMVEPPDNLFMEHWLQFSLSRYMPTTHLAWLSRDHHLHVICGKSEIFESIAVKLGAGYGPCRIPHQGRHIGCLKVPSADRMLLVLSDQYDYHYQPHHLDLAKEVLDYFQRFSLLSEGMAQHSVAPTAVQRHMLGLLDKTRRYWKTAAYRQLDDATGLPQLYQLEQRFSQILMRQQGSQRPGIALLVVELSQILEYMSEAQRDMALKKVAERWRRTLRGHDLLLRGGERQFVILLERVVDRAMIKRVISRLLDSLKPPVQLDEITAAIDCVIGIKEFGSLENIGQERALSQALDAMHQAQASNMKWNFYNPSQNLSKGRQQRVAQQLAQIIGGRHSLQSQFQPIIRLQDNQLLGFEVNASWTGAQPEWMRRHSVGALAHRHGLTKALDYQRIRLLKDESELLSASLVALHLSGDHLGDSSSVLALVQVLEQVNLPREQLLLEFSEPEVVSHNGQAINSLNLLKEHGFLLGMDRFGSGHSPLDMLIEYPVRYLKVADEVTHKLPDPSTRRWFKVVRDVCSELGMHLVVNGIDDLQQHHLVLKLGCEYGQGDYIARPMSEQLAKALLKRH